MLLRHRAEHGWDDFRLEKTNLLGLNLRFGYGRRRILAPIQPHFARPIERRNEGLPKMENTPFAELLRLHGQKATDERRGNLLQEEIAQRRQ